MLPIHERNAPWTHPLWRAEVFDHLGFISFMASWIKPKLYIEYGLADGDNARVITPHCERAIGVDMVVRDKVRIIPNLEIYEMTTENFNKVLKENDIKTDLVFIDACHDSKVAFQDFKDIFPHVVDNGFIFLHDTYPTIERLTEEKFCHDSWKVPFLIKHFYQDRCEIVNIPICPGLCMVKK